MAISMNLGGLTIFPLAKHEIQKKIEMRIKLSLPVLQPFTSRCRMSTRYIVPVTSQFSQSDNCPEHISTVIMF